MDGLSRGREARYARRPTASAVLIAATLMQVSLALQQETGPITGIVRDANTGAPLADVRVSILSASTLTDPQGRFTFEKVEPGFQRVSAADPRRAAYGGIYLVVKAGEQSAADIYLKLGGIITGRVVDGERQPVVGAAVLLLGRRYQFGELVYSAFQTMATDQNGAYRFEGVAATNRFLVLAKKPLRIVESEYNVSDAVRRELVLLPTFYPDSREIVGALGVALSPGETRTGVDIRMASAPSFCVSGSVDPVVDGKDVSVTVTERLSFGSGWSLAPTTANVNSAGGFRVCGLHPGEYQFSASGTPVQEKLYATTDAIIVDNDLRDLNLLLHPPALISGELKFDPPPRGGFGNISVSLKRPVQGGRGYVDSPERPPGLPGGGALSIGNASLSNAGPFTLGRVRESDWQLNVGALPEGCYLKEAAYGAQSVLYKPLPLAVEAGEDRLRLVVACDGGSLTVRVADSDGNPASNAILYLLIADAPSEGALAVKLRRANVASGWSGTLSAIPPGQYLALVTDLDIHPLDADADAVDKIWRARGQATQVEIGPGATAQLTVQPLDVK